MTRIGILGGTFSPAHLGHLELALLAKKSLNLSAIYIMPCQFPPHKKDCLITTHRLNILRKIFINAPSVYLDFSEILRNGPSLTHLSLSNWQKKHPKDRLFFIQGSDSFATITEWENWLEMIDHAEMVVIPRGTPVEVPMQWLHCKHRIHVLDESVRAVSSTDIRTSKDKKWIIEQMGEPAGKYYLSKCID